VSRKTSYQAARVRDVEPGKSFVMHSAELIASAAWRARPIHVVRLLDRLEIEHCNHAGLENGYLVVTYDQFVEYGIGRRFLRRAIDEAIELGLLRVPHQGLYRGGAKAEPSHYRLTYLKSKAIATAGAVYYVGPTNDWRTFAGKLKRPKIRSNGYHG